MKRIAIPCLLALLCLPQLAQAQAYRCRLANGTLSFQDQPCQPGAGAKTDLAPVQGYAPSSTDRATAAASGPAADSNSSSRAQAEAVNRSNRCNSARHELGVMQEQRPVYHYDNDGNRVYVADQDRPAAIAAARDSIDANCQ
jgi:hypothetical protein